MTIQIKSLAVKYRPRRLADVVGQTAAVEQIRTMITSKRFPQALLITGDSGCGKTTIARIIARYVNCSHLNEKGDPCGECPSCQFGDSHPDYMEINAADTRGIDDIRSLIKQASSNPMVGNKRIILADECFPGDALVLLSTGNYMRLDVLVDHVNEGRDIFVKSYDVEKCELVDQLVLKAWCADPDRPTLRVYLSDGSSQRCTAEHKWWSTLTSSMVRAVYLQGHSLLALDGDGKQSTLAVSSVEHDSSTRVYDITVRGTHNFFIKPQNSEVAVLVSNCHMLTPQASQILLKPLEDPPPNTLWIIATTNPEKLPTAIRGRCRNIQIKRVELAPMQKRLERICRLEKFDTGFEGWEDIVKAIYNFSSGQMRDAVEMLDAAIGAYQSGATDPKEVITRFVSTPEAEADEEAARFVLSVFKGRKLGMKDALSSIKRVGARQIVLKARWILQYLIDNATVGAKFVPYGARAFSTLAKEQGLKVMLPKCVALQYLLLEIELKLNSVSVDETVIGQAMMGNYFLGLDE